MILTTFQDQLPQVDVPTAVLVQPDGKTLVAGYTSLNTSAVGPRGDQAVLARYNVDGSLDTSFHGTGKVLLPIGSDVGDIALALDQNDEIVVAADPGRRPAYIRLAGDGTITGGLDSTFQEGAAVLSQIAPGLFFTQTQVAVAPDGKIVVAGRFDAGAAADWTGVMRFNANSSTVDTTFGDGGFMLVDVSPTEAVSRVLVHFDGKVVVTGGASSAAGEQPDIVRFTAAGQLDPTFDAGLQAGDNDGIRIYDFSAHGFPHGRFTAANFLEDGRIVAASGDGSQLFVARINDFNGISIELHASTIRPTSLLLLPTAQLLIAGKAANASNGSTVVDQVRMPAVESGSGFSLQEVQTDIFFAHGYLGADLPLAVDQQPDGALAIAGSLTTGTLSNGQGLYDYDFATARFQPDGSRDTAFDFDGLATTGFTHLGTVKSQVQQVVVRPDGNLIARARVFEGNGIDTTKRLIGYLPNGTIDTSFGAGGFVSNSSLGFEDVTAVAVQSDGKLLVGGSAQSRALLVRLNLDGSLDTSFGTAGQQLFSYRASVPSTIRDVLVLPSGSIAVTGAANKSATNPSAGTELGLAMFMANGAFDSNFSSDGVLVDNLGLAVSTYGNGLAVDSNNRLIVTGAANEDVVWTTGFAVVARFNDNGSRDTTFGSSGVVTLSEFTEVVGSETASYISRGTEVRVLADGKIVTSVALHRPASRFVSDLRSSAIVRMNPDGSLDTSFNGTGKVVDRRLGTGILPQGNGRIVVSGVGTQVDSTVPNPVTLLRFNSDGTLDANFGGTGSVVTQLPGDPGVAGGGDIVMDRHGRIVTGLLVDTAALARYDLLFTVTTGIRLTSESGRVATFTVALNDPPLVGFSQTLSSSDETEGRVSPQVLQFTPGSTVPQTITVTGIDDGLFDLDRDFFVHFSGPVLQIDDPLYNGVTIGDVPFTNLDNESSRMLRAYNPNRDFHFFTTSVPQFENAVAHGYVDETSGRAGFSILPDAQTAATPLYRLYNFQTGAHYYTLSSSERNQLINIVPPTNPDWGTAGWRDEGIEGYMYAPDASIASGRPAGTSIVYRLYNVSAGTHLFTENKGTRDTILAQFPGDWVEHTPLGYAYLAGTEATSSGSGDSQPAIQAPAAAQSARQFVVTMEPTAVTPPESASRPAPSPAPAASPDTVRTARADFLTVKPSATTPTRPGTAAAQKPAATTARPDVALLDAVFNSVREDANSAQGPNWSL